ncbi:MAG: replication-associated recombination protein A, partial [Rhodospirillaceae bacterium]|nr:replication-associated recombination protein A [Rhodospirillaceae bacterium]
MSNLFEAAGLDQGPLRPLAERLRPDQLEQVIGQDHLLAGDGAIRRMVDS